MYMNARGRHATSPKTNKQLSFGTLSLGNAFIATINNELHWNNNSSQLYY